jgi:hypothetical protein
MAGSEKWRIETTGKKNAELAASVLADFYEMAEIVRTARSPLVLNHEMAKKDGVPDEIATDSSYAPEARLLEYQEFLQASLRAISLYERSACKHKVRHV